MPTASRVCQKAAQSNIQRPSLVISSLVASGVFSLMKIPMRGSYIVAKTTPHRLMYTMPILRVTRTLDWASSGRPSPIKRPTIEVIATEKPTAGINERCMYRMAIHEAVMCSDPNRPTNAVMNQAQQMSSLPHESEAGQPR